MNAPSRRPRPPTEEDGTGEGGLLVSLLGLLFGFDKRTVLVLLWLLFVLAVLYGIVAGP